MDSLLISLVPAFPLFGAILNGLLLQKRASRVVAGSIATLMVALSAALSFLFLTQLLGGAAPGEAHLWTWMSAGPFTADVAFRVDQLTATMMCVITGIGSLIHLYSIGYMDDEKDKDSVWRFFAYLNLFIFAMLLLVMGDNFVLMFVGWEGVGLCSYLLIGFWYENNDYASAGKKAFITNRVGDFSFITGLFLLFWTLNGHVEAGLNPMRFADLAEIIGKDPALVGGLGGAVVTAVCLLFFGGATGKSAQIPLYVWLPDAMAGPTPVSALIHAATMVTSGVYMICRLNFLFVLAPAAMATIATVGALTAFVAATIAMTQNDIKKVLAYSTVSQLGFMFLGVGVGGFVAGFFHVVTHAFFKALMFLGSGSIIHALHHEQDMRKMGGLSKHMKLTFFTFLMGYLAIIGVPGFSGFFSKDEILWLTWDSPMFASLPLGAVMPKVLWALATCTALLTAFYMSRLMFMTFAGTYRGGQADAHGHDAHGHAAHGHDAHGHDAHGHGHTPHESPMVLVLPLAVLAFLSVIGGAFNLPHWLPGANGLHHFMEPVFEYGKVEFPEGGAMEYVLMVVTLVGIAASVGTAWLFYVKDPARPKAIADKFKALYEGSLNKWYVDELYELVLLTPIVTVSRQVLWAIVDAQIIDGLVNGAASAAQSAGRFHGRIGNGKVQAYAISIAAGAAILATAYAIG